MEPRRAAEPDFSGQVVNFVQLGLGDNNNLIQLLGAGVQLQDEPSCMVAWLLQVCSEREPDQIKAICAEPVPSLVKALRPQMHSLPNVVLAQVAIADGKPDAREEDIYTLSQSPDELLEQMAGLDEKTAQGLRDQLRYLYNMSCLGELHPQWKEHAKWIRKHYGVNVTAATHKTEVLTYEGLARRYNFLGTQVLMIDAEGHDASIVRSLIKHCERNPAAWPHLIQFETMGHCNLKEKNPCAEENVIQELQKHEYILVGTSHHDTHLALESELYHGRLNKWAQTWVCASSKCEAKLNFPYFTDWAGKCWCARCQWE